jgi:two-component system, NtrC family, response regulator AtoC
MKRIETALPLVLVVSDESAESSRFRALLSDYPCRVQTVSTGLDAILLVEQGALPNLVFLDLPVTGSDGLDTLKRLKQIEPALKVVMLSSVHDPQRVVRCIRLGAEDCLVKPCKRPSVVAVLRQYLSPNNVAAPDAHAEALCDGAFFVAASPAMRKLRSLVAEVAPTDIPVMCIGESGTGKEVIARLLHSLSKRRSNTFLKVNCAALPGELLESELFGYEQGAFTGAVRAKPGKFELCAKGTILLDEFGEMPPQLQAKLLHVLQDGEFTRLGGRARIKADVRVVAATNVDIGAALASKRLREDLYYRLSAVVFEIPPLRQRREEIPVLLNHFLEKYGGKSGLPQRRLSPVVSEYAERHDWPGNVREIENFVKRYLALGDQAITQGNRTYVTPPPAASEPSRPLLSTASRALKSHVNHVKRDAETAAIKDALAQTNWNRKAAAAVLQVSYKTLLAKLRLYGLDE